jgi:multidrug resistance efflux pump
MLILSKPNSQPDNPQQIDGYNQPIAGVEVAVHQFESGTLLNEPLVNCEQNCYRPGQVDKRFFIRSVALALPLLLASCEKNPRPQSVSGTIETDEVHVASRYGGRVTKTLVEEGGTVKAGQVIVELEASELAARRDQAAAQLAELQAGARKEELAEAKQQWQALAADLEQARSDAKRADELFANKTISDTEHEQTVTKARRLEKNVEAAKSHYELLAAGTREERIAQAKASLAELDGQLREMKVFAPTDAVLEVLSVKVGDVVAANREVATLLLTNHLWVRVYVPEPWLGNIHVGDEVSIHIDADPQKEFRGVVEQIGREAEFTPRNVQTVGERIKQVFGVKVRLDEKEGRLRAGMAADISFPKVPK